MCFYLGCSFTFERALLAAGVPVRNVEQTRNVPMYRTAKPCVSVGYVCAVTHVQSGAELQTEPTRRLVIPPIRLLYLLYVKISSFKKVHEQVVGGRAYIQCNTVTIF